MRLRVLIGLVTFLLLSGCLGAFSPPPDLRMTAWFHDQGGIVEAFRLDDRTTVTFRIAVENTTVDACIVPLVAEGAWKARAISEGHGCRLNVTEATGRATLPAGEYAFVARTNGCAATCTMRFGLSVPVFRGDTYRG